MSNHSVLSNDLSPERQHAYAHALEGYQQLVQLLSARNAPAFPDPSVSMAQMRVLMLLGVGRAVRMSDLAQQLGVGQSTTSSLVERLVDGGFARRGTDSRDRRIVLVSLTDRGAAVLDSFQELGPRQLGELLSQLTDEEVASINQAIDLLVVAARRLVAEETS